MGGRALKNTETIRIDREEFDNICIELIPRIQKHFPKVTIPLFYRGKESFGDIDVLCQTDEGTQNIRDIIENEFSPNQIYHNGNCWSFDFKSVQVDIITTSKENFEIYSTYLSYNDLGNMMGKLAHKLGLKYGEHGLWYNHYREGQKIGEVEITKNASKIFDFLGLDYQRYLKGFDELTEVFEYVYSSKYFDWRAFQLENLNHVNRTRDVKRKSYWTLLEWIENQPKKEFNFHEDKLIYLEMAKTYFPEADITMQVRKLDYEEAKKLYARSKFSGDKIIEKYNITGKRLGEVIVGFKKYVLESMTTGDFDSWVLEKNLESIWKLFEYLLEKGII